VLLPDPRIEDEMSTDPNAATLNTPISGGLASRLRVKEWVSHSLSRSIVFKGSLIMLLGMCIVSVSNFGYNVAMARMLGPAAFGHVSAVATLLMLFSALTLSFQMVCAKFVAQNTSPRVRRSAYRRFIGRAWLVGIFVGALLASTSLPISHLLKLPTPWLIIILSVGIAFSIPMGVKRGGLQGLTWFVPLSRNFIVESITKLTLAFWLVSLGYGVYGAVGAIAASVIVAFVSARVKFKGADADTTELCPIRFRSTLREGRQAIIFFIGQVVINNIDILLVKYFFAPEDAGLYAAVALFGRLLYFACWSIISAMFPVSAAAPKDEHPLKVLKTPLLLVTSLCALFILTVKFLPEYVVVFILGNRFSQADELLPLYATATAIYALSVVLIAYEMSRRIANTGWLQLVISGLTILGIALFHGDLKQVIEVQIVTMTLLLGLVLTPFLRGAARVVLLKEAA
jgi:O-antigen/teichoic acid export membrane protein